MKLMHFGIKFMPPSTKFMRLAVCFFFWYVFFFFPQVRKSCTCEVHDLRSHNAQCKKNAPVCDYSLPVWFSCSSQGFRYGFHALCEFVRYGFHALAASRFYPKIQLKKSYIIFIDLYKNQKNMKRSKCMNSGRARHDFHTYFYRLFHK